MRQNERMLWDNLNGGAKIHCFGQQKVLQSIARDAMAVYFSLKSPAIGDKN